MLGRTVITATSGAEALEVVREKGEGIGCVLMDANMPGMDGTATFQAIRTLLPDLPGILFSGLDREQGEELARTYGFADFIMKPFEAADLRRVFRVLK
jgi:CheY-like chemotaxis protein